jgi:CubicO group peptidase (beta-lactamase class C family)
MNRNRLLPFVLLLSAALCIMSREGLAQAKPEPIAELSQVLDEAQRYQQLRTVVVARNGTFVAERGYRGHSVTAPTNIKSAAKSIISALVGIAIHKGVLEGADQKIAPLLEEDLPVDPDPRLASITIGHLLSMQAGLRR